MTTAQKEEALALTIKILKDYWQMKPELFLANLHDDILWIGSMDNEYIHGAEQVRYHIKQAINPRGDIQLQDQQYEVLQSEGDTCLIVGCYTMCTRRETGELSSEKQRVTFEWVFEKNELKILHFHLSSACPVYEERKTFPTMPAQSISNSIKPVLYRKNGYTKLMVRDVNQILKILVDRDIIFIKSNRNNIIIQCVDSRIVCYRTLKSIREELPENFIQIGRSYLINMDHVIEIKKKRIVLDQGFEVPLPKKNIVKIIERIRENQRCPGENSGT